MGFPQNDEVISLEHGFKDLNTCWTTGVLHDKFDIVTGLTLKYSFVFSDIVALFGSIFKIFFINLAFHKVSV